jgi:hypothetical protein
MRRGITAVDLIGEGEPEPKPTPVPEPGKPIEVVVGDVIRVKESVTVAVSEAIGVSDVVGVTERVAASVNEIISPRYATPGAVEGALQAISSRGLLHFVIYDSIFGARVRCDIPSALKARALNAFDERVLVTGMVARDSEGHPRHIKVVSIEPIRTEELPQSIRGVDPDFTGDLTTDEYLKRGWFGSFNG